MFSFLISILALVLGYFLYGKVVEGIYKPNPNVVTPAIAKSDGVDFIPMSSWRVFMIQFLNIAGTGPIFGAIMGAKFGPACYLWIVFGSIFAGAVHDYISGMISMKYGGVSLSEIINHYRGRFGRAVMLVMIMILLLLVGAVFVYSPGLILGNIAGPFESEHHSDLFWMGVIFVYYLVATLLPIDKLIGKIYPLFGFSLLFMAVALFVCLLVKWPSIPEFWDGLQNRGPSVGVEGQPIFPCLFITVACGAISGFHATQSPMMARCMKSEKLGRPIFYGAMITEGLVALIWAAISSYFFFDGGMQEVGALGGQAPEVVTAVSTSWLGIVGGFLAILGVVAAPITTGDTALRSARLIVADNFHIDQAPLLNRLLVCIPIFGISFLLLMYNVKDADGFNNIWRYFGWINQSLAAYTLWIVTVWLVRHRKRPGFLITLIPAMFMTVVCIVYICGNKAGLNLPASVMPWIKAGAIALSIYFAARILHRHGKVFKLSDRDF